MINSYREVRRRKPGRSHRNAPRKKRPKKARSSAPVNHPGLAPATAAAFPASPQSGCRLPKALNLITPQKLAPQEFHRLKGHRYSNGPDGKDVLN
ncbi:MAG: hypothetical protein WCF82_11315 [Microcoleus sp.]